MPVLTFLCEVKATIIKHQTKFFFHIPSSCSETATEGVL